MADALPAIPFVSRSFKSTPAQNDLPIARMTVTRSSAEGSASEERLDLGQHLRVQRVAFFGPIEGDDTNRAIRLGFDQDQ